MDRSLQAFPICDIQIHVIDLLLGSGLDPVAFKCRIIALDIGRSFEPLSYVWGDIQAKRTVRISGYSVEVTRMSYTAFECLRYPVKKRTLWIDQVCIDQTNTDEKSHQVSLMRTIYKKCSQYVV